MAGTYKVTFDFVETLALRDGYELHKPYHVQAEELVVVAEDRGDYISLQHLLVVRHDGETHVINHWRQDWSRATDRGYFYAGGQTWTSRQLGPAGPDRGGWLQSVYNVADSPRYSSWGNWTHRDGVSSWTGSETNRPLPLRENHLRDKYRLLASINTHIVTDKGWIHQQTNRKLDPDHPTQPVLSLEHGVNRYTRVPDKDFEKAHKYWKNTRVYWSEVREVWAEVFAKKKPIRLAGKWKGDTLYSHLFGLADEYWGQGDASGARPRIEEIISAFLEAE